VFAVSALTAARRRKCAPRVVHTPQVDREAEEVRKLQALAKEKAKRAGQGTLFALEDYIEVTPAPTVDADVLRQTVLKDVPPPPKRREKRLSLALSAFRDQLSDRYHAGAWMGAEATALAKVIRLMTYDSVIYSGDWSLELLDIAKGYPYYKLAYGALVFGIVDIPVDWRHGQTIAAYADLPRLQAELARYLIGCGFTADMARKTLTAGAAITPYEASKRGLYRLLKVTQEDEESE
jgi:hypothetical protein